MAKIYVAKVGDYSFEVFAFNKNDARFFAESCLIQIGKRSWIDELDVLEVT